MCFIDAIELMNRLAKLVDEKELEFEALEEKKELDEDKYNKVHIIMEMQKNLGIRRGLMDAIHTIVDLIEEEKK